MARNILFHFKVSDDVYKVLKVRTTYNERIELIRKISDGYYYKKDWKSLSINKKKERSFRLFKIVEKYFDKVDTLILTDLGGKFITALNQLYRTGEIFEGKDYNKKIDAVLEEYEDWKRK